jgi:hypothetical protein
MSSKGLGARLTHQLIHLNERGDITLFSIKSNPTPHVAFPVPASCVPSR